MTTTDFFKHKLLDEQARLEKELATIAHKLEDGQWEAVSTSVDDSTDADPNEVADKIEDYENNHSIVESLQKELTDVTDALARIEAGTYGFCGVSGEKIEEDRLMANPSARTCKAHL
jgi:RNA polymerase-binding transcription factor DksA